LTAPDRGQISSREVEADGTSGFRVCDAFFRRGDFVIRVPVVLILLVGSLLACGGCGESGPTRLETFPVVGKVLVDGEPAGFLAVNCVLQSAADKEHPTESKCLTENDGRFKIATYVSGDGVPEGDYVLTFQWGELNLFTHSYDGDKLNGRYRDPATSPIKFTVIRGEPTDLGEINLTTKD
jgi:hypothetical protein